MLYYIITVLIILIILLILIYYCIWCAELDKYISCVNSDNVHRHDIKYLNKPKVKSRRKVVISLTTIPDRIDKLKPTLTSLLSQNVRVDKIYLNIPYKTLKGKKYKIPKWLNKLKNITIRRVDKDYGPATKLLPTLKHIQNDNIRRADKDYGLKHRQNDKTIIIVVDDDVIYGTKTVEVLVKTFYERGEKEALTIYGFRVDENMELKEENFICRMPPPARYRNARYVDIVAGHDSFIVTPEMFDKNIYDYDSAPRECVWVDDVWISGWLSYNNVDIYAIGLVNGAVPISNVLTQDTPSLCYGKNSTNTNNKVCLKWFRRKGIKYIDS